MRTKEWSHHAASTTLAVLIHTESYPSLALVSTVLERTVFHSVWLVRRNLMDLDCNTFFGSDLTGWSVRSIDKDCVTDHVPGCSTVCDSVSTCSVSFWDALEKLFRVWCPLAEIQGWGLEKGLRSNVELIFVCLFCCGNTRNRVVHVHVFWNRLGYWSVCLAQMVLDSCSQQEWAGYHFKWDSCKSQYLEIVFPAGLCGIF